jgi:hypothetical protein
MRLLQDDEHGNLNLVEYDDDDKIPPYAILSHTWGLDGQEVTLRGLVEGALLRKDDAFGAGIWLGQHWSSFG